MLVLQPTGFCNIDCSYCYLSDRLTKARMQEDVIAMSAKMLAENGLTGEHLSVVWHAGEPLVLPISYYEQAMAIVRDNIPAATEITHYFQTNATLISDEWCKFFLRPDVSVGVSMDGPQRLHDLNRVTRSGKGTYDTVMKGITCLQEHDVGFHVISVLTKQALFFPDEFYDFFCANDISEVCFNVEEIEGANQASSLSTHGVETLYRQFMTRFLSLASNGNSIRRVREFAHAYGALFGKARAHGVNDQSSPFAIVSVATNGDFSSYSPELLGIKDARFGDFSFGNVLRDALCDVVETAKFRSIHDEILAGVDQCRDECPYFAVCGGGAPANKIFETGSFAASETMFCKLTVKAMTDIVLEACQKGIDVEAPKVAYPTL